jgi:hypothetical protein
VPAALGLDRTLWLYPIGTVIIKDKVKPKKTEEYWTSSAFRETSKYASDDINKVCGVRRH